MGGGGSAGKAGSKGEGGRGSESPTAKWNQWAKDAEQGLVAATDDEGPMMVNIPAEKSYEESPAARKKRELAKMRAEMRASLQQTQSRVLSSMNPAPPRPSSRNG